MSVNILTQDDLLKFKTELFAELKSLLSQSAPATKKWLKSYQVREMLGISRGTLQHLHNTHQLRGNQVGGLLFFDYDDIQKLMEGKKNQKR